MDVCILESLPDPGIHAYIYTRTHILENACMHVRGLCQKTCCESRASLNAVQGVSVEMGGVQIDVNAHPAVGTSELVKGSGRHSGL